ncbi:MAG: hypothetical protein MUC96_00155 [Myxococcaceae bacterium]|jgi:hypothetical protein|nr:hypothetical protein [Myxococcaceae bacterium]
MSTPEEAVGLAGQGVVPKVRGAMGRLDDAAVRELLQTLEAAAWARHCVAERDGRLEAVRVMPRPLALTADQLRHLHVTSLALLRATQRVVPMFLADAAVRAALPVPDEAAAWLRERWTPAVAEANLDFGQLDAVFDPAGADWTHSLRFLGLDRPRVATLHLLPAAERVVRDAVFPVLEALDPSLTFELAADVRALLLQRLLGHLEALRDGERSLCLLAASRDEADAGVSGSPAASATNAPAATGEGSARRAAARRGFDAHVELAQYGLTHFGVTALHADLSELELRGQEVWCQGQRVSVAYRDESVSDLRALGARGVDVEPLRQLFLQNRMVSPMGGELDQKALFEVFTDEAHARHFSSGERRLFHRHVPWTRLVRERRTSLPDGREGELVSYARGARETLVLKPNRASGGSGVLVGPTVTAKAWDAALEQALRAPDTLVVQQLAPVPVMEFPVVGRDEQVHAEPFFVVLRLAPTDDGVSVVGRASLQRGLNIAQRGGLVVAAVVHGSERVVR